MKLKADVQKSAVSSETFRFGFCHGCISPESEIPVHFLGNREALRGKIGRGVVMRLTSEDVL